MSTHSTILLIQSPRKPKLICSDIEQAADCLGMGGRWGASRGLTQGLEQTWGVMGLFTILAGNGFTGVYVSTFIRLCALNMCNLLYTNYASIILKAGKCKRSKSSK